MTARSGPSAAVLLVLAGLVCQEVGASFAVLLFPQTGPLGMVALRLLFSAVLLLAIARPRLRGHTRAAWRSLVWFGVVLASMNALFYLALERLPLGVAVTIEVLGPLTLSIVTAAGLARWLWAGLALLGVGALGAGGWDRLDALGLVFILGAAVSWAFYIVASARVGAQFPRLDGLALALAVGAVLALPLGIAQAGAVLLRPEVLGLGAAVALLSSTIPYALELIALRRLPASAFAILMSLGPATASIAGFLLLGQHLAWLEIGGIALVIAASIGAVTAVARGGAGARHPRSDEPLAEPLG